MVELRGAAICGAMVVEVSSGGFVALWSVSGAERVARSGSGEASVWGDSGGYTGAFRDSTIRRAEQAARPRASRFRGVVPAGGRVWNLARRGADHDANFEPLARKMTGVRWSHLMHSMTQVFILSDSQKGIALMRRGLRA